MDFVQTRAYLLNKPEATEEFPFYPDVPVFKIKNKIFAILSATREPGSINLKCDPDQALLLRFIFDGVQAGYHMNKKHWNTVILDSDVPEHELQRMIDHSYGLVVKGLTKTQRTALELAYGPDLLYSAPHLVSKS